MVLSSTHFCNGFFLRNDDCGLDDVCLSLRRIFDSTFNGFVFGLGVGCAGLNYVKLKYQFRVLLCDFGLDVLRTFI